jgi:hypothetical protein
MKISQTRIGEECWGVDMEQFLVLRKGEVGLVKIDPV